MVQVDRVNFVVYVSMKADGKVLLGQTDSLFTIHSLLSVVAEDEEDEDEEELGGLFRVSRPQKSKKFQMNAVDCSRFIPDASHNWDMEEVRVDTNTLLLPEHLS